MFKIGDTVMIIHKGRRHFEYPLIQYEITRVYKKMFKTTYDMIGETESGNLVKEANVPEDCLTLTDQRRR